MNAQRDIGVVLTEEMETELRGMAIYQQDLSWKMFVPPLPVHQVSKLLIKTFQNKTKQWGIQLLDVSGIQSVKDAK